MPYKNPEDRREQQRRFRKQHPDYKKIEGKKYREKYLERSRETVRKSCKKIRHQLKETALAYFGGYCYECFEDFALDEIHTRRVQFDHCVGPKLFNPAIQKHVQSYFEEVLIKCEPVHHECHIIRTTNRKQLQLKLTSEGWIPEY